MDRTTADYVIDRLRAGKSMGLIVDSPGSVTRAYTTQIANELTALGRTTIWIDASGVESGAELGGRVVEGCMMHLDPDELGDVLERLPSRGRIDLEALAELLMLPEQIAANSGRRVIVIIDPFPAVEQVIGHPGLAVIRDALMLRERVTFLFVGSHRLEGLFARPTSPLYQVAEVVDGTGRARGTSPPDRGASSKPGEKRGDPPSKRVPLTNSDRAKRMDVPAVEPPSADPLVAALMNWSEPTPPPPPKPARPKARTAAEMFWEQIEARGRQGREFTLDDDEGFDARRRRRGRR